MLLGMKKMEDCNQQILQQSFLFQGLSKEEFQELLVYFPSPEVFAKGEIIYSRSHFRKAIGIILCGAAQVTCGNGTSQILVNQIVPGNIFGATTLFEEQNYYVNEIKAEKATTILFLSQQTLTLIMKKYYIIAENYIRFLSNGVRFFNHKIAGFALGSSHQKVAMYCAQHCDSQGRVQFSQSMVSLAKILHIARSSLYRSLSELVKTGFLRKEGNYYYMQNDSFHP